MFMIKHIYYFINRRLSIHRISINIIKIGKGLINNLQLKCFQRTGQQQRMVYRIAMIYTS